MPKLSRDISYKELCKSLGKYGYTITRQTGSHIRLKSNFMGYQHSITIPAQNPIKIGTLNNILNNVAAYLKIQKEKLIESLF
jgi:predicted RNA binding protein YcfA (HicA-like mRNA interferase family)